MTENTHVIWSSDINYDDWDSDAIAEAAGYDPDIINSTENTEELIYDLNKEQFQNELDNCDIEVPEGLVVFGVAGRWDGEQKGIVSVDNTNISDCLQGAYHWDDMTIEVKDNNLLLVGKHHDGTDIYTIRKWKSSDIRDRIINLLDNGEITTDEAYNYTASVADIINKIYGW